MDPIHVPKAGSLSKHCDSSLYVIPCFTITIFYKHVITVQFYIDFKVM